MTVLTGTEPEPACVVDGGHEVLLRIMKENLGPGCTSHVAGQRVPLSLPGLLPARSEAQIGPGGRGQLASRERVAVRRGLPGGRDPGG